MARPFVRQMQDVTQHVEGIMYNDTQYLQQYQFDCAERFSKGVQLEQETYLLRHPEIQAMLKMVISKCHTSQLHNAQLREIATFFTRPAEDLDQEIRDFLNIPPDKSYVRAEILLEDVDLLKDLYNMVDDGRPKDMKMISPDIVSLKTASSSFLSLVSSPTTPATPEPEPVPELTMSQIFYNMISNTINKATMLKITETDIKYDIAYVELMKIVENAMEITVEDIKADIRELFDTAYQTFEIIIVDAEIKAAELAWENRMRKKLKRLLRRQNNFKGYETPPSPKSETSVHPSYKISPQRVCECHPKPIYNRYPKDRYGIYLPIENDFELYSITVVPDDIEDLTEDENSKSKKK